MEVRSSMETILVGKRMKIKHLFASIVFFCLFVAATAKGQTDWPIFGHDPGGLRYSPLKQINTKNVGQLRLAWQFDTVADGAPPANAPATPHVDFPAEPPPEAQAKASPRSAAEVPARPPRASESIPLVVDDVLYLSTGFNRVIALDAETGHTIWQYESKHTPALRGVSYWPGTKGYPPQIVFGTLDGWLISLNAKTGKPSPCFGTDGLVNLKAGVTDKFPKARLSLTSPPSIYKNLVITGSSPGEMPALGAAGDIRAWDMRTGKLIWTFHTIPRPGEPNHEVWQGDEWVGRSGVNSWGFITVDAKRGMVFVPIGTPNTDFYGGDRKGSNLYGSSLVALDAATGKMKWYFQTTHHDNWDYDLASAPMLITTTQNGKKIPAVAQLTKQGYLFIFNRLTGKPIFDVKEVPVASDNPVPGDEYSPTQPIPVKPPPLARTSFAPNEIATLTPEHEKYCRDLLAREGGAMTGGPFAQYGLKLRVIFPSWTGGTNWGGGSFDPKLGYVFADTKSLANFNKLVPRADGKGYRRVGPDNPPPKMGDYFWDGAKQWPCQEPPWGELVAVNVNSGEIAWRVPLGSFEELDQLGVPKTGTPTTNGGPIATAGGLVFIGATVDGKFRAFDSRTGREVWVQDLGIDVNSIPITWRSKNGKQYVAVFASGQAHHQAHSGQLFVYSLP
jgi:glucose dehydrogenase